MCTALILALILAPAFPGARAQEEKPDEGKIRGHIAQLGADFLEEREAARKALEKVGKGAEGLLVEALSAADFRVRHGCLDLLTKLKSPKALPRAAELLKGDDDPSVRDAAFALIRALGKEAEDHLISALESSNPRYRLEAVQGLAEFKSEKCVERMMELHDREQDKAIREAAFKCLQSLGKAAEPFLLRHLVSTDPALRREALEGLKGSQNEPVLAAVAKLFVAETDDKVIHDAYTYLRAAGPRGEPHLIQGLKGAQPQVRLKSIEGLRELKSEKALEPAAEVFQKDDSAEVRKAAALLLQSHGTKAEDHLVAALSNPNAEVKLLAIHTLGEVRSEKPLDQIAALFREDKSKQVHRKAFDYLKRLGARAEKELLAALSDEDKDIRREAIEILGKARSEAAIPRLIEFLIELDPDMKRAAEDALVKIGPKAIRAVDLAVTEGKVKKRSAEAILALYYEEEVERMLDKLVTAQGGSGFFEGQFKELEAFGKEKAGPVLLKIVRDPGYAFRATERPDRPMGYTVKMREMAVAALGELGDASAVATLKEILKTVPKDLLGGKDEIYEELVVALNRLGDAQPLDEFIKKVTAEAETAFQGQTKEDGCSALFSLGLVLNRVGRRDEAAQVYARLLKAVEDHQLAPSRVDVYPTAHYNLACLSALKGDKEKSLDWLEKAIRAGFVDRQWIGMDRDLEALRGEERFKKMLADDKLFQAKPNE